MSNYEESMEKIYRELNFMTDVEKPLQKKFRDNEEEIKKFIKQKHSEGDYYITRWFDFSIYERRCLLWVVNGNGDIPTVKQFGGMSKEDIDYTMDTIEDLLGENFKERKEIIRKYLETENNDDLADIISKYRQD